MVTDGTDGFTLFKKSCKAVSDRGGGRQTVRLQGLAPGRTKVTLSFRNVTGGPQIVVTTTVTVTE